MELVHGWMHGVQIVRLPLSAADCMECSTQVDAVMYTDHLLSDFVGVWGIVIAITAAVGCRLPVTTCNCPCKVVGCNCDSVQHVFQIMAPLGFSMSAQSLHTASRTHAFGPAI